MICDQGCDYKDVRMLDSVLPYRSENTDDRTGPPSDRGPVNRNNRAELLTAGLSPHLGIDSASCVGVLPLDHPESLNA